MIQFHVIQKTKNILHSLHSTFYSIRMLISFCEIHFISRIFWPIVFSRKKTITYRISISFFFFLVQCLCPFLHILSDPFSGFDFIFLILLGFFIPRFSSCLAGLFRSRQICPMFWTPIDILFCVGIVIIL